MIGKYQKGDIIRVIIPSHEQNKKFHYLVLDAQRHDNYHLLCLDNGMKDLYSKLYTDKAAVLVG